MYPNVKAEMARKNIILEDLAKELGRTVGTVCNKLNGEQPLLFSEAKVIKKVLHTDMPLEELFEEAI